MHASTIRCLKNTYIKAIEALHENLKCYSQDFLKDACFRNAGIVLEDEALIEYEGKIETELINLKPKDLEPMNTMTSNGGKQGSEEYFQMRGVHTLLT